MTIKNLFIAVMLVCCATVNAQSVAKPAHSNLPVLSVGDKIPEVLLNNLLNHTVTSEKLSAFNKNKYLIIDFFATWCLPCVRALPELDAMQKKMGDRLQVIVVSQEKKDIVARFLQKNKTVQGIALPFVTSDSILSNMFPHRIVPHEIWIDRNGVVKAITSGEELNEHNIADFIANKPLALKLKKDILDYNEELPLFVSGNGGDGNDFLARSILAKRMEGMSSRSRIYRDSTGKISKAVFINAPSIYLFFAAYAQYRLAIFNMKRVELNTKDSLVVNGSSGKSELEQLMQLIGGYEPYCYELILPQAVPDTVFFRYMLNDLNRYFTIQGKVEKRTIPCWVLIRTKQDDQLLESKGGKVSYPGSGKLRNVPLSGLVSYLNQFFQVEPIVDETGFTKPVDMDLNFPRNINEYPDIEAIRKNLQPYGLDLVKQPRSEDIMVISDK